MSGTGSADVQWIRIPGGSFMMGMDDSNSNFSDAKAVHEVAVPSFDMSKTLVTNKQYQACVDAGADGTGKDWSGGKLAVDFHGASL